MKHQIVPDILIEQYALGELSDEKARIVEQSEGFADRLAQIQESNAEILRQYPAELFVSRIHNQFAAEQDRERARSTQARPERGGRKSLRWLAFAIPGAAAIVVGALIAVPALLGPGSPGTDQSLDDVVRLKGGEPRLSVYRFISGPETSDDAAEELPDGAVASAGDRLQLEYNAADRLYGAIVSVDGRGAVFVHYPYTLSSEPELIVGRNQQLRVGYQLDDAPRFEHFYFITSTQSFSVPILVDTIRSQATQITERANSLKLGLEFEVTSVTIIKGE